MTIAWNIYLSACLKVLTPIWWSQPTTLICRLMNVAHLKRQDHAVVGCFTSLSCLIEQFLVRISCKVDQTLCHYYKNGFSSGCLWFMLGYNSKVCAVIMRKVWTGILDFAGNVKTYFDLRLQVQVANISSFLLRFLKKVLQSVHIITEAL